MKKLAKNCKYDTIDYIPLEFGMDNPSPGALLVNINKMSNIFTLDLKNIASALVIAVIIGIGASIAYVLKVGDIFAIDVHSLANVFALAVLGGVGSLISSLLTTSQGKFAGAIPVK
ncbi:MAG: hypothetical protein WC917_01750 [Bacilli bacterium]|jgi:hypothetical protein